MKRKRASLIINPRGGENLAKIADVLAILAAAGWSTDIKLKEYGGQAMELATRAAEAGDDVVIAYGGDGTLNQVVNGVMNARGQHSAVGAIPGGTANVWAGEVGIPADAVKAALTLVNSQARKVDIGRVEVEELAFPPTDTDGQQQNGKGGRKKNTKAARNARQHFLLMAGLGIDAAVMGHVSKPLKYRIGPLAVGVSAAKELPAHHPFPIEIRSGDWRGDVVWKGEAIQVVVGNTRHYADITEMTPQAYIDDGVLDVCVITAGNPLTTTQQIFSLLLRRKPDNLTAEYFQGAHLSIHVPASIDLQLDGSAVKLDDYLSKSEQRALEEAPDIEQVMVTYRFDAMPRALRVAIPCTYDDTLFEHTNGAAQDQASAEARAAQQPQKQASEDTTRHDSGETDQERQEALERVQKLLGNGRRVAVVGMAPDPAQKNVYIVAGSTTKQSTGEARPVAVRIDEDVTIVKQTGEHVPATSMPGFHEGETIVVKGKKSKRGVIRAKQVVI